MMTSHVSNDAATALEVLAETRTLQRTLFPSIRSFYNTPPPASKATVLDLKLKSLRNRYGDFPHFWQELEAWPGWKEVYGSYLNATEGVYDKVQSGQSVVGNVAVSAGALPANSPAPKRVRSPSPPPSSASCVVGGVVVVGVGGVGGGGAPQEASSSSSSSPPGVCGPPPARKSRWGVAGPNSSSSSSSDGRPPEVSQHGGPAPPPGIWSPPPLPPYFPPPMQLDAAAAFVIPGLAGIASLLPPPSSFLPGLSSFLLPGVSAPLLPVPCPWTLSTVPDLSPSSTVSGVPLVGGIPLPPPQMLRFLTLLHDLSQHQVRQGRASADAARIESLPKGHAERSPSPPPVYNALGVKANTREVRLRGRLADERSALLEGIFDVSPALLPATFRKRKKVAKVFIPVKDHPTYKAPLPDALSKPK